MLQLSNQPASTGCSGPAMQTHKVHLMHVKVASKLAFFEFATKQIAFPTIATIKKSRHAHAQAWHVVTAAANDACIVLHSTLDALLSLSQSTHNRKHQELRSGKSNILRYKPLHCLLPWPKHLHLPNMSVPSILVIADDSQLNKVSFERITASTPH